jgi:histidinol phosphatase-like enzyme
VNAVWRMLSACGGLLAPDDMPPAAKRDGGAFGPGVQFRYQRELEPPSEAEGFSRIDVVAFVRRRVEAWSHRAVLVWCDGVLARSRAGHRAPVSPDDVEIVDRVAAALRRHAHAGARLLGIAWRPEIAIGSATAAEVDAVFAHIQDRLGAAIDIQYCPHGGGPPVCWCRKPLPGLGVAFIRRYELDPAACIYIGGGPQDAAFARRLGFQYRDAAAGDL